METKAPMIKTKKPKGLNEWVDKKTGKFYVMVRGPVVGGANIPLPGMGHRDPITLEAYRKAVNGKPIDVPRIGADRVKAGTLQESKVEFFKHALFTDSAESTQDERRRQLEKFCGTVAEDGQRFGDRQAATLDGVGLSEYLATFKPHPRRHMVNALRPFCKFMKVTGRIAIDPMDGIQSKRIKSLGGADTWFEEQIATYREFYPLGTRERLAMETLLQTSARLSDGILMGPDCVSVCNGVKTLRYTQVKTKWVKSAQPVCIPMPAMLQAAIDATPIFLPNVDKRKSKNHQAGRRTWLQNERGHSWSKRGFGNWFVDACTRAGLKGYTPHGLRKAMVCRLFEMGHSAEEVASVTGHIDLNELRAYAAELRKEKLARKSIATIDRLEAGLLTRAVADAKQLAA